MGGGAAMTHRRRRSTAFWATMSGIVIYFGIQITTNAAIRSDRICLSDPIYIEKFDLLKLHPVFFDKQILPNPTRLLVLGSSRSQLGVDARRLARQLAPNTIAFNFSTHGGGPLTNMLYFQRLLKSGVCPDAVLIEVHPCLLHHAPMEATWLGGYRLRPGEPERLATVGHTARDTSHLGLQGWLAATHEYRIPALNKYAVRWLPCPHGITINGRQDPYGFAQGLDIPFSDRSQLFARTLQQYGPILRDFQPGGSPLAALRQTLQECHSRRIAVALYLSAEDSQFRQLYRATSFANLLELLKKELVSVFTLQESVPDIEFADGHHLTPVGAERFTDCLAVAAREWLGAHQ
jgi:hypothetical protein